jgi:hypothetical protein
VIDPHLAAAMRKDQQERYLRHGLIYAAGVATGVGLMFLILLLHHAAWNPL